MIDFATGNQLPALQAIWRECFGDDAAYIDYLFTHLLLPERILVRSDGEGRPLSMLCIEPFTLATGMGNSPGAYLFGIATRPDRQGNGYSTELLQECHRRLRAQGIGLSVLVPAESGLFSFYGERGYETAFYAVKASVTPDRIPAPKWRTVLLPASANRFADLRDTAYRGRSQLVRWSRDYLAYVWGECRMSGGEVLRIGCAGETGYAVCYRHGNQVAVKELALPDDLLGDALAALHARYGAARYTVYLPSDAELPAKNILPFAMVQWYDKKKREQVRLAAGKAPWIAHVLD